MVIIPKNFLVIDAGCKCYILNILVTCNHCSCSWYFCFCPLRSGYSILPSLLQVYGMLMARSTYEGIKSSNENKRPFVLTRAGFVGSQRYAATWTGDNLSNWEHLHMSISMVLQLVSELWRLCCLFLLEEIPFTFGFR